MSYEKIKYTLDWEGCKSISKIRQDLDLIEKLGATHINITAYPGYEGSCGIEFSATNEED